MKFEPIDRYSKSALIYVIKNVKDDIYDLLEVNRGLDDVAWYSPNNMLISRHIVVNPVPLNMYSKYLFTDL
jgi:hypothetical protein